jgi:NADPH-dependent 2,4-dienoyl-CoA reductase/sulfur reductase-like enzyme
LSNEIGVFCPIVIRAGPLGLELAQALARLGVVTKVFDEGPRIAGLHDEDVATEITETRDADWVPYGINFLDERRGLVGAPQADSKPRTAG